MYRIRNNSIHFIEEMQSNLSRLYCDYIYIYIFFFGGGSILILAFNSIIYAIQIIFLGHIVFVMVHIPEA